MANIEIAARSLQTAW